MISFEISIDNMPVLRLSVLHYLAANNIGLTSGQTVTFVIRQDGGKTATFSEKVVLREVCDD